MPPFIVTLTEAQQRTLGTDLVRLVGAKTCDRVGIAWGICSKLEEWEQEETRKSATVRFSGTRKIFFSLWSGGLGVSRFG